MSGPPPGLDQGLPVPPMMHHIPHPHPHPHGHPHGHRPPHPHGHPMPPGIPVPFVNHQPPSQNGHTHSNSTTSQSSPNPTQPQTPSFHNSQNPPPNTTTSTREEFDLASYVYNIGFIHTAWADTFLSISPHQPLRLHALFASRSPVLYRYLSSNNGGNNPPYHINMSTDDKNITSMSLSMALATLYGHQLDLSQCDLETAKGLLASGCLLGIDGVANQGYQVIMTKIKDNLEDLFSFATKVIGDGGGEDVGLNYAGPYPPYTNSLVTMLMDYILANFNASTRPIDPAFRTMLLNMPFLLLKHVCESEKLLVKSHMERHAFAREIIAARREHRRAESISSPYEENVVLAFGGGKGGVEVIRKSTGKKKTLWKVSN